VSSFGDAEASGPEVRAQAIIEQKQKESARKWIVFFIIGNQDTLLLQRLSRINVRLLSRKARLSFSGFRVIWSKLTSIQSHLDNGSEIRRNGMAEIRLHEGESIENALRRFKRKVMQEDIIKEVKKHSFYLKPGEKKRIKQALARKRSRKKVRREPQEDRK